MSGCAVSVLSWHHDVWDKEIALFAALLIKEDAEFEQIREFRELIGDKPWEWFEKREFVRLGIGRVQDRRTGGVMNWKIAKLMDRLWDKCLILSGEIPAIGCKKTFIRPIGFEIDLIAKAQQCSYFAVLTYLVEDCCVGNYDYKLRLLLMIAAVSDGFGLGLWSVDPSELKSPLTTDLRTFLATFFPDYKRYGNSDDAINLFGFDRDCDFFYCYLAYKELQKKKPKECSEFATTYIRWYSLAARKKPYQFREVLPEI